ncbi:helix-turn-helix domain-containing protein [Saccharopolyspora phatthalungensis]|uniref:helix-turn-helix domain-containing protein n=1 Tax=Saccharopolyspora phatthalungensis TaxID=664693 RepID=UPI0035E42EB9
MVERHADEVWRLWRAGYGQREIGRELGISHESVRKVVCPCGGIAPAPRRRAAGALTFAEREEISRGLAAGKSLREIARGLGRNVSVVSLCPGGRGQGWQLAGLVRNKHPAGGEAFRRAFGRLGGGLSDGAILEGRQEGQGDPGPGAGPGCGGRSGAGARGDPLLHPGRSTGPAT